MLEDRDSFTSFNEFVKQKSFEDDTWKYWIQFLFKDCFAYIGLYLAIRGSNWQLRLASLKLMAPLFSAFDRDVYQRIIPHHLTEIHHYPQHILQNLQAGGFTVSITGQHWHSVALDEAHEMGINKDLKLATTYPTPSYLQKTSLFFNYRIDAYKNFLHQLFPNKNNQSHSSSVIDDSKTSLQKEQNIKHMCAYINKSSLFSVQTTNHGVVNCFTSQKATHEQQHDMLHFREIGTESYLNFITHRILMITSTDQAPVRKKKILTMNKPKSTKRRVTRKEKEAKLVTKCLRRRLAWASRSNQSTHNLSDQYSIFPRALADEYGNPHKASKSTWKEKIRSRYKFAPSPVLLSAIPPGWIPQTVIIDAMFLINTTPLRRNKTITDFTSTLSPICSSSL